MIAEFKLENALKIQGWMKEDELIWLAEQAQRHTGIVEIGCYHGRSTVALAENTSGVVYAVDTWEGSSDFTPVQRAGMFAKWRQNTKHLQNIITIVAPSLRAAQLLGNPVDMVFIDAEHEYASVAADIVEWSKRLTSGGLLCGHDYVDSYPGVKLAVNDLVPGFQRAGFSIWYKEL
jgi:predicted O-methyltransferase YrrM